MYRGGIANKLGNLYEQEWAVRKLLEVIAGRATSIRYEGITEEFAGLEFALHRPHSIEWHQTKINAPNGNWTLKALKNAGVMDAFKARLSADLTANCVFVSQDPSKQMRDLCENAQISNNLDEFKKASSLKDTGTLKALTVIWSTDENTAYEWLQRCEFRTESGRSIIEFIDMYSSHILQGNANVFEAFSNYLLKNLNTSITTQTVRKWVAEHSPFRLRPSLDPTYHQKIDDANQRYLLSYPPFGFAGQQIQRPESQCVVDEILSENGPSLIILTGDAGSGKSGIVRDVMAELKDRNVPHLAFRIDRYLSCTSRNHIGRILLECDQSPVSALETLAKNKTSVLIIDQIDAVSETSGRTGAVKEVLLELVREAGHYGDVRCLLVCRGFDLENDPQYRTLEKIDRSKQVQVPHLSWENDVAPILENTGVGIDRLNESQRKLLTLPVNLSVFLKIDEPNFEFTTSTGLFQRLLNKKIHDLHANRNVAWSTMKPLSAMADWMSENQELICPDFVLDEYDQSKEWLASEGLITVEQNKLAFFHESFFDFIFARTLANSTQNISDFLTTTEQHLFRRTQVRQILTLMRDTGRPRYLEALTSILTTPNIRFHIKLAVAQWLATLDNVTVEELRVIQMLDDDGAEFPVLMRKAIFTSESWFDLLNDIGELFNILEKLEKPRRRQLLVWLSRIVGKRPRSVAEFLKNWWDSNPARRDEIIEWFDFVSPIPVDQVLTALLYDVVRSAPENFLSRIKWNKIVAHVLDLCVVNPEASSNILQLLFAEWFKRNPGKHLFAHDGMGEIDLLDLDRLAEKAPPVFLDSMIPALVNSIQIAVSNSCSSSQFHVLYRTSTGRGPNKLFSLFRDALQTLAKTLPQEAESHLDQLDPKLHEALLHLHLETIQTNPTALGYRFAALLNERYLFSAGLEQVEWLSFAETARTVVEAGCLSIQTVEKRIFRHQPEIESARSVLHDIKKKGETNSIWERRDVVVRLSNTGRVQWYVLRSIGHNLLSPSGKKRLLELERKFHAEVVPAPHTYEAKRVGSPIPTPVARRMTDSQWYSAINKHVESDSTSYLVDGKVVGGAWQLAQELEELAASNPNRFAQFFLGLPENANPAYGRSLLRGLARVEHLDENAINSVLCKAHEHPNRPFGLQIVRFLERNPVYARDNHVFTALLWYAENGEANKSMVASDKEHLESFPSINDLIRANSSLIDSGINSTRGVAWIALGRLVQHSPQQAAEIWILLKRRTYEETCPSIRVMMLHALAVLYSLDPARFSKCLHLLTRTIAGERDDLSALVPLATNYGVRLFHHIERDFPDVALELMERMIDSPDRRLHLIGSWWTLAERLRQGNSKNKFPQIEQESPAHSKLWASILCEFVASTEFRNLATSELEKLFLHESPEVRIEAGNVFSHFPIDEFPFFMDMTRTFVRSPAFKDSTYPIFTALTMTTCDVTELVIEVLEIVVYRWKDYGLISVLNIQKILKREYVNTESRPKLRTKVLNLVDYMAENSVIGVDDVMVMDDR